MDLPSPNLLASRHNRFSQNGEDGILEEIFAEIGPGSRTSCEFGAWDGIRFSNCRYLILNGWRCLMIEGDANRYKQLRRTYANSPAVVTEHCFVDVGGNSIDKLLCRNGFSSLDFLSVDIDGLDYAILASLRSRPRVICVEVSAGHVPDSLDLLPPEVSGRNVGQPLNAFCALQRSAGYSLVAYSGNAFFVRDDCLKTSRLKAITATQAYDQFLAAATVKEREWLLLVNEGRVAPFYKYSNERLNAPQLGISSRRARFLRAKALAHNLARGLVDGRGIKHAIQSVQT